MSANPEGCTSVEEWLARGGKVKTEAPPEKAVIRNIGGQRFEFERDETSHAPFRCRLSGVYGFKGPGLGQSSVRPHKCHHVNGRRKGGTRRMCGEWGTVHRDGHFWCEEHA